MYAFCVNSCIKFRPVARISASVVWSPVKERMVLQDPDAQKWNYKARWGAI
jgi:hypothetical protein